jgi:hypothetical protein
MLLETYCLVSFIIPNFFFLHAAAISPSDDLLIQENQGMSLMDYFQENSSLPNPSREFLREVILVDKFKTELSKNWTMYQRLSEECISLEMELEEYIHTLTNDYNCPVEKARSLMQYEYLQGTYLNDSILYNAPAYAMLCRDIYLVKKAEDDPEIGGAHWANPQHLLCDDNFPNYKMQEIFYRNYDTNEEDVAPRRRRETSGAILHNPDTGHLVIVFAGTKTGADWASNLNILKTGVLREGPLSGLDLHAGFYEQFIQQRPEIEKIINSLRTNGGRLSKITVTGHSLGGALSSILAYHIKKEMLPDAIVENITFASPRVFSRESSAIVEKVLGSGNIWRIWNAKDVVGRVPSAVRFKHSGFKIKIKSHQAENFGADIDPYDDEKFVGLGSKQAIKKTYKKYRDKGVPTALLKSIGAALHERERYHAMKIYVPTLKEQFPRFQEAAVRFKVDEELLFKKQNEKEECEATMEYIAEDINHYTDAMHKLQSKNGKQMLTELIEEWAHVKEQYTKAHHFSPNTREYLLALNMAIRILRPLVADKA